ncbi:DeoR/GlpR family DNA-binding transcription regulator [Paenibacillus polymyxa]|uniref:DeoR/GlpR family DNA-binding transcription regulator n=1 Tax=Paenibacillus polymyxa TaxID=1406 RepID=UPI00046FE468|nr:DeoR/GlpR family DNA-binding transcription regulator [Paenibacillus polymyxa]
MKARRLQDIEEYVHSHKNVTLDELCQKFDVSKNTIRRDISQIVRKGSIEKVYGGVASTTDPIPFENRGNKHSFEKNGISHLAASCIEENDLIFIDSGTTTCHMAKYFPTNISFTILTNSLDIINGAAELPLVNLLVIGNTFKQKTKSFVGIDEPRMLVKYNVNKAFMAATGVSITHGLTNSDLLEFEIKKIIAQKAEKLILLADSSKFGKSTLLTYASLEDVDIIVSSNPLTNQFQAFCATHNIEVKHPKSHSL